MTAPAHLPDLARAVVGRPSGNGSACNRGILARTPRPASRSEPAGMRPDSPPPSLHRRTEFPSRSGADGGSSVGTRRRTRCASGSSRPESTRCRTRSSTVREHRPTTGPKRRRRSLRFSEDAPDFHRAQGHHGHARSRRKQRGKDSSCPSRRMPDIMPPAVPARHLSGTPSSGHLAGTFGFRSRPPRNGTGTWTPSGDGTAGRRARRERHRSGRYWSDRRRPGTEMSPARPEARQPQAPTRTDVVPR
jgi:hypothetical protein